MTTFGIGHNALAAEQDADEFAVQLRDAGEFAKVVDAWVEQVPTISTEDQASRARDLLAELTAREKRAETARKAEKQPHLDAARDVDTKYQPLTTMLAACARPIKVLLEGWLTREKYRIATERAAAQAAAKRLADEAEAARKAAAASHGITAGIAADEAEKRASAAAAAAELALSVRPQVSSASGGARKVTLRTTWHAKLVNFPRACRKYSGHPDLVAVLERLASADARAGQRIIDGFEIYSQEHVA